MEMIAVKVSLLSIRNPLLLYTNSETRRRRRRSFAGSKFLCRSKDDTNSNSESSSNSDHPQGEGGGDLQKQELLARIAMLQTQKLRLTDYLDERSSFLTDFAEQANSEIDAIGENALKDLQEAEARIMGNIESRMQAFEESLEMEKEESEERDKELADFEGEIEKGRNEGMFFKSFKESGKEPVDKAVAKEEARKIILLTIKSASSKTRKNVYLAFITILSVAIVEYVLTDSSTLDWRKLAVLAAIWVALVTRFIYEQKILPTTEKNDATKEDQESK